VDVYKQLIASCPSTVRVSVEFKPTDPATRFAVVPNTATALALAHEVGAQNFGLTLDIGHMLMASENPAQSIAMTARAGKLFGIHVNDAHVRLGAEDGLAFGAVNPLMSLEVVSQLQKSGFNGHIYFDTFPTAMGAVHEAAWNIRTFRSLWRKAAQLSQQLARLSRQQDALGVLQLLEAADGSQQKHEGGSSGML
jgi:sugar phosphate isomerase/epimerase